MADVHGAGAAAGSETADPALPVVVPVAPVVRPRRRLSARALGALAIGATAIGALAIGTLAIGCLAVGRARIRTLRIDKLIIGEIERR
jgi:hypothetical protein